MVVHHLGSFICLMDVLHVLESIILISKMLNTV